jgi:hypothetical protein
MSHDCESCGMPIESGAYCKYCLDEQGKLQDFDTRFERMVGWARREDPGLSREQAEANTLKYMARMPAWKDHPRVKAPGGRVS